MKRLRLSAIIEKLESKAPVATAESWDNVGLLAGDYAWSTSSVVVSVDLSKEALKAAVRSKAKLIVTHHPVIFPKQNGIARVISDSDSTSDSISARICQALAQGIGIYSSHTNFDRCALEVIAEISKGLGVTPIGRLFSTPETELLKLVVFVPQTHLEKVRSSVCAAGAGQIGNYDQCTFSSQGVGTFRGNSKSRPFLGISGEREFAKEERLETVFPKGLKSQVLKALNQAHPYEEVAYDLYPILQTVPSKGLVRGLGYGFWGEFSKPKGFSEIAQRVRQVFQVSGFWASQPHSQMIKRIAFSPGDASKLFRSALEKNCDLYITGEFGYHAQLEAQCRGMSVMELGHRESELFYLKTMKSWLSKMGLKVLELNIPTQKIWHAR